MAKGLIPFKTPQGLAELSTRARRLGQRHRTVLLLVDGRRDEAEVRSLARQAGAAETGFDDLLEMGLIARPTLAPAAAPPLDIDLGAVAAAGVPEWVQSADSVLPSAHSLHPESVLGDSLVGDLPGASEWNRLNAAEEAGESGALAAAREILERALRAEAPLAGRFTLLKLRRAATREELLALLDEVEARLHKPHRSLVAAQTIRRARQALDTGAWA